MLAQEEQVGFHLMDTEAPEGMFFCQIFHKKYFFKKLLYLLIKGTVDMVDGVVLQVLVDLHLVLVHLVGDLVLTVVG